MKQSLLVFGALSAVAGLSQASSIIDDFSSYTPGANMNGATPPIINGIVQPSWVVSNGTSAGGDIVIASDALTGGPGRAVIGGLDPIVPGIVSLSSTVNVTMADLSSVPSVFSIDVTGFENLSGTGNPPYSIVLGSTAGNLLTIDLTPTGAGGFLIGYSSAFFGADPSYGIMAEGAPTQFQLETFFVSAGTVGFNLTNAGAPMASGTLSGADETDFITSLSINMNPAGGAGDGFLLIDNVTLIPEPSTALLGLVSAAFFFTRRRR